jgi:hypothetical protein
MTAFLKVKLAVFGGYWRLLDGIGAFWRTLVFSFVILEIKVSIRNRPEDFYPRKTVINHL